MKKLDKLILSSFIGPFILTFLVVVFILLMQHMLKYFDDIVGKDLGWDVLGMLMFDFSIFMTPIAIPLAVLLSSLMTFGNLGEHFELTAVKSAGISLLRTLRPIFFFVVMLAILAFYSNNYFVPKAALDAYSLLWDIKQKKPALDLKEGAFYNGIPDLSIKVNEKDAETGEIKDVIIYDHRNKDGNKQVTLADSGRMYTIFGDNYLVLELFHGQSFIEGSANAKSVSTKRRTTNAESLSRIRFEKSKFVLDLSSFDMTQTDKSLFASNRIMRNLGQLEGDRDSLNRNKLKIEMRTFNEGRYFFNYLQEEELPLPMNLVAFKAAEDSIAQAKEELKQKKLEEEKLEEKKKLKEQSEETEKGKVNEVKTQKALKKSDQIKVQNVPTSKKEYLRKSQLSRVQQENPQEITNKSYQQKIVKAKKSTKPKVSQVAPKEKRNTKKKSILTQKKAFVEEPATAGAPDLILKKREELKERLDEEKLAAFISEDLNTKRTLKSAINTIRQNKTKMQTFTIRKEVNRAEYRTFDIQWHKIIAGSFSCLVMFLIGAPLGSIIKRGGLGIPVLISIVFFIIFYVFDMTGQKWAKQGLIEPWIGVWSANITLLPIGLFFLRQARNDARLFDADFYNVMIARAKDLISRKKN